MPQSDLETLMAERAIHRTLLNYCRAMDRIDDALARLTWWDEGLAHYENVFKGTGHEFCTWVDGFHRSLASTSHEISNCLIEVNGDRAHSETYVTANLLHFREGGGHRLFTGHGRYLDRWSRRGERWAIDDRHYVRDFTWNCEIEAGVGPGRRDPADPSYSRFASVA